MVTVVMVTVVMVMIDLVYSYRKPVLPDCTGSLRLLLTDSSPLAGDMLRDQGTDYQSIPEGGLCIPVCQYQS